MSAFSPPDIFHYLSFRAYLRDWFAAKKSANPRYSHRLFSRKVGKKAPGYLGDLIEGRRRLTDAMLDPVLDALGIRAEERAFFEKLVALDQARSAEEQESALIRVQATRRFREARLLENHSIHFLRHWYYSAIHELAATTGFREDPEWIAKALRPSISVAQARQALAALVEADWLIRDPEGRLRPAAPDLVTPHEARSVVTYAYHRGMMQRAQEALTTVHQDERHFVGVTVGVPAELLGDVKAEINALQERILAMCGEAGDTDRVMQFNVQFFPLSRPQTSEET